MNHTDQPDRLPLGKGLAPASTPICRRLFDVLGGRFHYLIATAAAAVSPLLLGPAQIRIIGLAGYGQIVTVVLLAGMIASVATLGLSNSVIAKSATLDDPVQYVGSLMLKSALPSMGVAALFFGAVSVVAWFFPNLSLGGFSFIAAAACAGFALSQSRLWMEGLRTAGKSGAYLGLSSITVLLFPLVATLALYLHNGPGTYVATWSLMLTLLLAVKMIRLVIHSRSSSRAIRISLPELIRFGSPLTINSLVGTALTFSDRIAIAAFIGIIGVGQYQLASLAGLASVLICNGLNLWWLPRVVSAPNSARHGALARMLRETTTAVLVYSAVLATGLTMFVSSVIEDETDRSIVVSVGLLIGVAALAQPLYLVGTNWLYSSGRTGSLATRSIAANIGQGMGTWMVVGHYGLYGVAIVLVIAQWLQAISVSISLFRESDKRRDLTISLLFGLLGVLLLCWAFLLSLSQERMVFVQVSLLFLSMLTMIRYIRRVREDQ